MPNSDIDVGAEDEVYIAADKLEIGIEELEAAPPTVKLEAGPLETALEQAPGTIIGALLVQEQT